MRDNLCENVMYRSYKSIIRACPACLWFDVPDDFYIFAMPISTRNAILNLPVQPNPLLKNTSDIDDIVQMSLLMQVSDLVNTQSW